MFSDYLKSSKFLMMTLELLSSCHFITIIFGFYKFSFIDLIPTLSLILSGRLLFEKLSLNLNYYEFIIQMRSNLIFIQLIETAFNLLHLSFLVFLLFLSSIIQSGIFVVAF